MWMHTSTTGTQRKEQEYFTACLNFNLSYWRWREFQHRIYEQASPEQGQCTAGFLPTVPALCLGQWRFIFSLSAWRPRTDCPATHDWRPPEEWLSEMVVVVGGREACECMRVWGGLKKAMQHRYCKSIASDFLVLLCLFCLINLMTVTKSYSVCTSAIHNLTNPSCLRAFTHFSHFM